MPSRARTLKHTRHASEQAFLLRRDLEFESGLPQRRVLCEPLFNARQTGLDKQQAVQEKLALLACYREGINAHLTAAIAMAEERPAAPPAPRLKPATRLLQEWQGRSHEVSGKLFEVMPCVPNLNQRTPASRYS